ncbi:EAL domain-containing response regulator [uncultured Thiodictyon sp.]|uniref:EAL domain-containing response regulator n=1 Tax=uncultured Thiodictyon sp. TaxID=1846217 RepID=UPI0025E4BA19|nr:EAL domain-containing response regulator [uncultured Thiodictyon sp.]
MNLICLDDDPRMEPALRRFAVGLGHGVRFHTATASFKLDVQAQLPDMILLDLELGQENGIDVIHWLAERATAAPLILLSGHGDDLLDTARRIARASGMTVAGAINKGQIVRDLPALLGQGRRPDPPPRPTPDAALPTLTAAELARFIREDRIEPHFQPIVDPHDGRLRGAEVLARLRLPSGALLGAPAFIPLAQSTDLLLALTEALFARLIGLKAQLRPLALDYLSVNLCAAALDRDLERAVTLVRGLLAGLGDCCGLQVELTETAAMADSQPARELTAQLRLLGVRLAMDDFGTGYSSVRALTELPFDTLKIDLSFVSEMFDSAKAQKVLQAIVNLGHNLGLTVVAEGVETDAQRRFLIEHGADLAQGYLFGRPMEIQTLVRTYFPVAPAGGTARLGDPFALLADSLA